jgi:dihydrofolate reductase
MAPARRIVTFNWVTADGYFAASDGDLQWVVPDDEQAKAAVDDLPRFDTLLFGRVTYELFDGFWRHAVEDSTTAADPLVPANDPASIAPSRSG